jgi:hypothetical protein
VISHRRRNSESASRVHGQLERSILGKSIVLTALRREKQVVQFTVTLKAATHCADRGLTQPRMFNPHWDVRVVGWWLSA